VELIHRLNVVDILNTQLNIQHALKRYLAHLSLQEKEWKHWRHTHTTHHVTRLVFVGHQQTALSTATATSNVQHLMPSAQCLALSTQRSGINSNFFLADVLLIQLSHQLQIRPYAHFTLFSSSDSTGTHICLPGIHVSILLVMLLVNVLHLLTLHSYQACDQGLKLSAHFFHLRPLYLSTTMGVPGLWKVLWHCYILPSWLLISSFRFWNLLKKWSCSLNSLWRKALRPTRGALSHFRLVYLFLPGVPCTSRWKSRASAAL
jgi:hypothetical protein